MSSILEKKSSWCPSYQNTLSYQSVEDALPTTFGNLVKFWNMPSCKIRTMTLQKRFHAAISRACMREKRCISIARWICLSLLSQHLAAFCWYTFPVAQAMQLKHPPMSAFVSHWRVMFCVLPATANILGKICSGSGLAGLFLEVDVPDLECHAVLHHSTNRLLIHSFGSLATDFQPELQLHAGIGQM